MHPTTEYAERVLEGDVVAGNRVKWACMRHLDDLSRDDVYFDEESANRIINFYKLTPHVKGKWAGNPIKLESWQKFIVGSLFGWKREKDDTRKYREAYIQVARKNGKTSMLAPLGIYMMRFDGEAGAEVYSAATTRDQAKEIFDMARSMVKDSKHLGDLETYKNNISHNESFSKFEPLSSDYDTLEGKNIHGGLVDELHAHPDSGVWDVLADGTGAREQPLMIAITTAGFNQESFCYKYREDCLNILNPETDVQDDSQFAYVAELDEEDDWTEEENWEKANPNLGVSLNEDNLKRRIEQAKRMPSQQNRIICKRLNIWTNVESRWMDMAEWKNSSRLKMEDLENKKEELEGEKCYSAIDLSSKLDITAYIKVFQDDDEYIVIPEFWIPEDTVHERSKKENVPYDTWARSGYINATPGNVIDYKAIQNKILEDYEKYEILEVGRDRWGSIQMAQELEAEGLTTVAIGQGYKSMSEPMKELEKLVLQNKLVHFNHPVLRWMASNVVAKTDPAGNIKPDKDKSKEKIDGIVALIMAMDRTIRNEGKPEKSVYEERGVRAL